MADRESNPSVSVPTESHQPFDAWMDNLKSVMRSNGFTEKSLATICPKDWHEYYISNYTPEEAFGEDMSYA